MPCSPPPPTHTHTHTHTHSHTQSCRVAAGALPHGLGLPCVPGPPPFSPPQPYPFHFAARPPSPSGFTPPVSFRAQVAETTAWLAKNVHIQQRKVEETTSVVHKVFAL
jgi:hypothetical protein